MRHRLKILGFFALFWVGFQVVVRALFLLYNHDLADQLTASEILLVFWHGLKMDFSMSGYFVMFTGLILTISVFTVSRALWLLLHFISILGLLVSSIVVMVDLELYRHWGFRVDTTPFFYMMGTEEEALGSVNIAVAIQLLLILAALFTPSLFVYNRWLSKKLHVLTTAPPQSAVVLFIVTALVFIPIRGSFTVAPMNTGFVYFHKTKTFANHAAINAVWNFLRTVMHSRPKDYPRDFYNPEKAVSHFETLYDYGDATAHVFSSERPNVILFILESFTAGVVEPLGGVAGLTPNINALAREGVLFDSIYSSGDRTDKGLVSILSGYPAQPLTSIVKFPKKTQNLPYLNRHMNALGYSTSFIYGGDIDFANLRSYLMQSQFGSITTREEFPEEDESKWGVHDHIMLDRALQELDTATAPFFKTILTLSSHEPFDVPMEPYIKEIDDESLFLNACHYTDKSIGAFIEAAKKTDWWDNTVIIFVADHGHRFPGNKVLHSRERFRIPLLFAGGAVKRDTVVHRVGSQTDLANTLLGQLSQPDSAFRFSQNLLARDAQPFAFYFFNNGFGYVDPKRYAVFDNTSGSFILSEGFSNEEVEKTKSYQQVLYLDYNAK